LELEMGLIKDYRAGAIMIPILPFIEPLAKLAAAAIEHTALRKGELASRDKHDHVRRLNELEDSDFEQARLIRDLSENVERLAEAVQSQLEENKRREARLRPLVYAGLAMGLASLAISLATLLR
jgi:hypothetical protein